MKVEGIENDGFKSLAQDLLLTETGTAALFKSPKSNKEPNQMAKEISPDKIEKMLQQFEKTANRMSTQLSFSLDDKTGKTVIKVIDKETGDVIRQIPPEEALKLSAHMQEMVGILFDKGI